MWIFSECSNCGPFWARETTKHKIQACSRCGRPLSKKPENLIYSDEELMDEEDCSEELKDFGVYCRCQLTSSGEWQRERGCYFPGEFRSPTVEEVSDRGEYAANEVEDFHWNVKKLLAFYREQGSHNTQDMAWLDYWSREYRESEERLRRMRKCFEKIDVLLDESDYGDDFIQRDMDDLWSSEWFHNWKQTEHGQEWTLRTQKLASVTRTEDLSDPLEVEANEEAFRPGALASAFPALNFDKMPDFSNKTRSLEQLAQDVMGCVHTMKDYRDHLEKDVDDYRSKAPPPVNSETRFHWRKSGALMHLTLSHPKEDGTETLEIIGTDPDDIRHAKSRIEAARWLAQREDELQSHIERERQLHRQLDRVADILDELDYQDRFMGVSHQRAKRQEWKE